MRAKSKNMPYLIAFLAGVVALALLAATAPDWGIRTNDISVLTGFDLVGGRPLGDESRERALSRRWPGHVLKGAVAMFHITELAQAVPDYAKHRYRMRPCEPTRRLRI
jgi:hypothetical protein